MSRSVRAVTIVLVGIVIGFLAARGLAGLITESGEQSYLDPIEECGITEDQFQYEGIEPWGNDGDIRQYIVRHDPSKDFYAPGNFAGTIEVRSRDGDDKFIDCKLLDG